MNNPPAKDYSVKGLAELLSVSRPTVYRLIRDGDVAAYKAGKSTRITYESVEGLRNRRATVVPLEMSK